MSISDLGNEFHRRLKKDFQREKQQALLVRATIWWWWSVVFCVVLDWEEDWTAGRAASLFWLPFTESNLFWINISAYKVWEMHSFPPVDGYREWHCHLTYTQWSRPPDGVTWHWPPSEYIPALYIHTLLLWMGVEHRFSTIYHSRNVQIWAFQIYILVSLWLLYRFCTIWWEANF